MGAISKTADQKVDFFYTKTRLLIIGIALSISIIPLPETIIISLSIGLILSIGLMHGATDHFLFMNAKGLHTKGSIPSVFFFKYLLTLALMALMWWIAPLLAFSVFILTSAYHFGQTQWQYVSISEQSPLKKLLYLSWGMLILSTIVVLNPQESNLLINSVISDPFDVESLRWLIFASGGLWMLTLAFLIRHLSVKTLSLELLELVVIVFVSLQGNLLLSFALFFGLWHSLRASQVQIDKLKEDQQFNWRAFILGSLPFTLISIAGIAILLWVSNQLNQRIQPEMLFLIAISVLTMPHMVIYEEFYAKHDQKV
jgi:Brp/Blh family beta-carotene 15,15'-monooxygenase